MSTSAIEGGCLCGAVRYRAGGAATHLTSCHCETCRRASAAPFVAWATFATSSFELTAGEPVSYRSSQHATRTFCGRCGTPLTFRHDDTPGEIDVTVCSMDDPELLAPKDHTWVSRSLRWVRLDDGLPLHEQARPTEKDYQ